MNSKNVKNIREPLKKPRPLKSVSIDQSKDISSLSVKTQADLLRELETLCAQITNYENNNVAANIKGLCALLKEHGEELDSMNKDAMDHLFSTLRNISREDRLDRLSRTKLLEVIEMHAAKWNVDDYFRNHYTARYYELEEMNERQLTPGSVSPSILNAHNQNYPNLGGLTLGHGEVLRSSGKYDKPTKISGKNYYKDEIVIRNSDSGKVMGIKGRRVHMIEELSDTVISFQRGNHNAVNELLQTPVHLLQNGYIPAPQNVPKQSVPVEVAKNGLEGKRIVSNELLQTPVHLLQNGYIPAPRNPCKQSVAVEDPENCTMVSAGAQDRLVQITGPDENAISHAKYYIEDTIKRNVSPVRDNLNNPDLAVVDNKNHMSYAPSSFDRSNPASTKRNLYHSYSMSDASSRESTVSVHVGNEEIVLSGARLELLTKAQAVLTDFFARQLDNSEKEPSNFSPRTTSISNNNQRFTLKKQASLKDNLPSSFSSSIDRGFSRQSSSMSSSSDDILPDEESSDLEAMSPSAASAFIPPPTYSTYTRDILLECARLPLSQRQPVDFPIIAANFPELVVENPVMFDPSPLLQNKKSS